ncbi:MAG: UDP-N-acetylglucosamine 2-epimerase (non-hydrolyzing) [Flavobacteriaceae bacterium]|nr:UDP-N-acetylglucosamine 2-epimerase (non-hydrolyzing) [Flavobacteriaceae bacterium]
MKVTLVAGARPNFMKIAPIIHAIHSWNDKGHDLSYRLVHTGQHYDKNLSAKFFDDLNIPPPDVNLDVKSGSQAEQTAAIMIGFEKDLQDNPTDLVLVVGDVNSTMACAIVAKKAGVSVAHVEAGIRSGDLLMPEEINRIVTDSLTDFFFTTSEHANRNLRLAGVPDSRIFFVGNVMIDTLFQFRDSFNPPDIWKAFGLEPKSYLVLTLHRPSNVDEENQLKSLLSTIMMNSHELDIIFPVHPRTLQVLSKMQVDFPKLHFVEPLGYLEFNYLVQHARGVLTDSGGITEETTVMHIPCITLRENTERPETCEIGTNRLVGKNEKLLAEALEDMMSGNWPHGEIPDLWDGHAADRIVSHIKNLPKGQ